MQLPHHEGREPPVGFEIGAKQGAAGLDSLDVQNVLEESRRHVQHGDRLAHERQYRGQAFEAFRVPWYREVTRPAPRGRTKVRQVRCQPLLQLARPAGSHQGRSRRTTSDVDQQPGTIWLRARAGKRGCRGPRSTCRTDGGDQDDPTAHRPAGLA